nr:DUF503 domain-containing protein [Phytoactinopolyspora limicola]
MFIGTLSVDLLLGDVRSLKQKRAVVRPIIAEIRRRYEVAVAEVGHLDLHRRAELGVAVVASDAAHCRAVLDNVERLVAGRPEIELLAARQLLRSDDDDSLALPDRMRLPASMRPGDSVGRAEGPWPPPTSGPHEFVDDGDGGQADHQGES